LCIFALCFCAVFARPNSADFALFCAANPKFRAFCAVLRAFAQRENFAFCAVLRVFAQRKNFAFCAVLRVFPAQKFRILRCFAHFSCAKISHFALFCAFFRIKTTVVAVFSDGKGQRVQTRFNLKIFH